MIVGKSRSLYKRAKRIMPGGVNSPARSWAAVGGDPFFIRRGIGSHIWDVDGNELIDYVCSWGPLILGHAHPSVVESVQKAVSRGTSYGIPTDVEVELAELIADAIPSIEMVRFVNSGTEATMSALRLSRAVTGRNRIVKFDGGYHGHEDALLVAAGSGLAAHGIPTSAGVNPKYARDTLVAGYNDLDSVERLFERNPGSIAAVIVEPVSGNMGVVPAADGILQGLRDITSREGALLIFDEVISGFRVSWGGVQTAVGVTPDLTCLGKIVGGGLPVGAYGGSAEVMANVSPIGSMYQAGTLSGNPVAMVAGLATLRELSRDSSYDRLEVAGARLESGLRRVMAINRIPAQINRVGSLLTVFFTSTPVTDMTTASASSSTAFSRFFHGLLKCGVYAPPSKYEAWFVSLAHSDDDIDETIQAAERTVMR